MRFGWLTTCLVLGCGCVTLTGCSSSPDEGPRASQANPDDPFLEPQAVTPKTHFAAGKLAEAQGRLDAAADNYRHCLKAEPNNTEVVYRLAMVLTLSKKADQALAAWERYVQLTGGTAEAYSNLAYTHQLAGNFKEAEANYLRALNVDDKCRHARVNYGLMLAQRDRLDEAERHLSKVLTPPQVEYNLASIYELRGLVEQARQHYREALRMDPDFRDAQTRLRMLDAQVQAQ